MDRKSAAQILNSRKLIVSTTKTPLRVTSVTRNFIREDGTMVHIINFNGMTQYQYDLAKEHFGKGEYEEAANLNISTSVLANSSRYVPSKGEKVDVEFSTITNKDGIEIIVVDSIVARQAVEAPSISGFTFEDDEAEDEVLVPNIKAGKAKVGA